MKQASVYSRGFRAHAMSNGTRLRRIVAVQLTPMALTLPANCMGPLCCVTFELARIPTARNKPTHCQDEQAHDAKRNAAEVQHAEREDRQQRVGS